MTFRSVPGADHLWIGATEETVAGCFGESPDFARTRCLDAAR